MDQNTAFRMERTAAAEQMAQDEKLNALSLEWMQRAEKHKYCYNYTWMGRPIIKFPNDIVLAQEIIWEVKPDLIIETGIAHGGSIIFSASMLELLGGNGEVAAVDIDIRSHNRKAIEEHPMAKRIRMWEGSSTDEKIANEIRALAHSKKSVMVFLDSLHTHDHVLREMEIYGPMVTVGSFMVVIDTCIEAFPAGTYQDRPWDVGNNPMTAAKAYLKDHNEFIVDNDCCNKLCITEAFSGYLRKVR